MSLLEYIVVLVLHSRSFSCLFTVVFICHECHYSYQYWGPCGSSASARTNAGARRASSVSRSSRSSSDTMAAVVRCVVSRRRNFCKSTYKFEVRTAQTTCFRASNRSSSNATEKVLCSHPRNVRYHHRRDFSGPAARVARNTGFGGSGLH